MFGRNWSRAIVVFLVATCTLLFAQAQSPASDNDLLSFDSLSDLGAFFNDRRFVGEIFERRHAFFPGLLAAPTAEALRGVHTRIFDRLAPSNRHLFRVVTAGQQGPIPDSIKGAAGLLEACQHTTGIVNSVQGADDAIASLVNGITRAVGFRPNINMYVAPPNTVGLSAHHDPQDVFIVQVSGDKSWRVCDPIGEAGRSLPTRVSQDPAHRLYFRYTEEQLATVACEDLVLSVGDVLYMPRGTVHAPATRAAGSVHLTVGLDGDFRWADFLTGLQKTGSAEPARVADLADCLSERDLNRHVPHEQLARLRVAGGAQPLPLEAIPGDVVDAVLRAFEQRVDWSACPPGALADVVCRRCATQTVHLMHQLQVAASQRAVTPWQPVPGQPPHVEL